MRYKQLGNGSAFNTEMVNSSFIVEESGKQLLIDCGYNVFTELRRLETLGELDLKQLRRVYITHMDDDHMGSIKSLLYYRFFVLGETTTVYTSNDLYGEVNNYLKDINGSVQDNRKVKSEICKIKPLEKLDFYGTKVVTTDTHHYQKCRGIFFEGNNSILYITGDTKACEEIKNTIHDILNYGGRFKIFHDFSNFNDESRQVHACKTDVERVYGELNKHITWYHNDKEFNTDWVDL